MGLPWLACVAGKVYFEVTVVEKAGGVLVGWAGTNFSGTAVGLDEEGASWGVYNDGAKVHRRAPPPQKKKKWGSPGTQASPPRVLLGI